METTETRGGTAEQPHLRRAIGPTLLLLFIVGDMVRGGIYALVGEVGPQRTARYSPAGGS